jgi:hypothetical protein
MRATAGTRIEETEKLANKTLDIIVVGAFERRAINDRFPPKFVNRSRWNRLDCVSGVGRIALAPIAKRSGA